MVVTLQILQNSPRAPCPGRGLAPLHPHCVSMSRRHHVSRTESWTLHSGAHQGSRSSRRAGAIHMRLEQTLKL